MVKKRRARLTLNNVLTGLFVALTSATDPVRETITLMSEGLTPLACQDACHQLILNTKDH